MDENKLTEKEILLLEKALQHLYHATIVIENTPGYYGDEYHDDVRDVAWKLSKMLDYDFEVLTF